jgi:ribosome recycling factor
MAQGMAEQGKIGTRAARREALDTLKAAQKEGLSEDDVKRLEKEVQKEVDDAIARINNAVTAKEADLRQP